MTKIFVLDTSAILASGRRVFTRFKEHSVVVPLVVIKELEKKRDDPELGLTARSALNYLEDLRTQGNTLSRPTVVNEEGGSLWIELNHVDQSHLPESMKNDRTTDTRILAVASALQNENPDQSVVLVSKDLPMRIIASTVLELKSEDLRLDYTPMADLDPVMDIYVDSSDMDSLYRGETLESTFETEPEVNSKAIAHDYGSPSSSALMTYVNGSYKVIPDIDAGPVSAKSAEQQFAINDLYDDKIKIVSLGGKAGSGKSLLSIISGIDQVLDQSKPYKKVIIFRPVNALIGQDIGYLPGEVNDKMEPYAQAVYDTLESVYPSAKITALKAKGLIEIQPLTYIRGRTLENTWVIVDEAQNLEKYILLTALSRLGQNSKVVLDWDVSQRDNLHVGKHDGVYEVVQRLLGNRVFSHTTLVKSERSEVAELVSEVLDDFI